MCKRQVPAAWVLVGLFLVVLAVLSEAGGFHGRPTFSGLIRANLTAAHERPALG